MSTFPGKNLGYKIKNYENQFLYIVKKKFKIGTFYTDQTFALLNFYCNRNAIIAIIAIIANSQ